ncbi:MAG: nuclear transport factor 2 family protein [Pyrinomonadaceae bacterium]
MRTKTVLKVFSFAAMVLGGLAVVDWNVAPMVFAQSGDEKAVIDVLTREAAAVEKGDMAALDKIWANDETVTVFESGHANYGWNDYRNTHLGPELKEFKNTKYAFSDMKVKTSGNLAFATFKYTLSADMGTRKVNSGGLGTAVLEKQGGKWRIVHWHSSAPRQRPSPTPAPAKTS